MTWGTTAGAAPVDGYVRCASGSIGSMLWRSGPGWEVFLPARRSLAAGGRWTSYFPPLPQRPSADRPQRGRDGRRATLGAGGRMFAGATAASG